MEEDGRHMKAVVLSGGGANGAYEVGVLKALVSGQSPATGKTPFAPDILTGTSVGSYNAGLLVSETTGNGNYAEAVRILEEVWLDRIGEFPEGYDNGAFRLRADFLDYLNPVYFARNPLKPFRELAEDTAFFVRESTRRSLRFLRTSGSLSQRALGFFDMASALSTAPLQGLVKETIDIRKVLAPEAKSLRVCVTNWDEGKAEVFRNKTAEAKPGGDYVVHQLNEAVGHLAILASTAIPGVFPPVKISTDGGRRPSYYVDGGVLMNTPLNPAIKAGAREIHVIYFDPRLVRLPADYLPNTLDTVNRFLFVAVAQIVRSDIENVRKINSQAKVAARIEPLVQQLEKDETLRQRLEQRPEDVQKALHRATAFVDNLAQRDQIAVHRHYPSRGLGGILGLLNFKRSRMLELIELGYRDTVSHDCERNRCVLPP